MARLPRLIVPFQPHHVIQKALSGVSLFQDDADYTAFLGWLGTAAKTWKISIHAYALLPDSLHMLVSPADEGGLGQAMQWIGRNYVPYYNRKYGRSGTLWQGRFKTAVIDADSYLLLNSRYIEYLPVRAGLVFEPAAYPWSSYGQHAGLRPDPVVTDHPLYWSLGNTPYQRENTYADMAASDLSKDQILIVEKSVLKGWPLGSDKFKTDLQNRMQRQVLPAKRGRPFKKIVD
ncbi:transposase [Duganella sp. FT92W]|uniref:Transposase n=1 Tax=Pseudoduganella rivuli TaxID=2666085 RepID=A0A7X2IJQ6_9BURK|nr:transposase [Pseudoduganella rivuli]MRV70963.1 transposase [Pseudoduganella rivuli]